MSWLGNFVFGKPQEASAQLGTADATQKSDGVTDDPYREANGEKVIPEVGVTRVECHPSGDMKQLELWMELHNESALDVEVRRFEVLGQSTDLGRFLKPGEKYEVRVYRGDTPRDDSRDRASIQYKVVGNGDYFQSDHTVEFKIETVDDVRWYLPCELKFIGPVRDI